MRRPQAHKNITISHNSKACFEDLIQDQYLELSTKDSYFDFKFCRESNRGL